MELTAGAFAATELKLDIIQSSESQSILLQNLQYFKNNVGSGLYLVGVCSRKWFEHILKCFGFSKSSLPLLTACI